MFENAAKKEKKQIILSLAIEESELDIITKIQKKYNLKRSEVARTLLKEGIAKYLLEEAQK